MGKINKQKFTEAMRNVVQVIPKGKAMAYGQIAALLGYPRAAQYVSWVIHWSDFSKVPYQRVVKINKVAWRPAIPEAVD